MYERIVVGYDGSDGSLRALDGSGQLARTWGCPIELVHVSPTGEQAVAAPSGWPVRVVKAEDAASTLLELVPAPSVGLLCLGTRGQGPLGEAWCGSVASAVLRASIDPLVLVGPTVTSPHRDRVQRVLVCLDGSVHAESILTTVGSWAGAHGMEVRLLYVAPPPVIDSEWEPFPDEEQRRILTRIERSARELRASGLDADWMIAEEPHVAGAVVRQAAYRSVDLIAMATHGRTGLRRVLTGSVSAEVVRTAQVPVLLVRPGTLS